MNRTWGVNAQISTFAGVTAELLMLINNLINLSQIHPILLYDTVKKLYLLPV